MDEIKEYWSIIAAFGAFIIGYSNLKSDHQSLRREFEGEKERAEKQRNEDSKRSDKARSEDNERTRQMFEQIRSDIKERGNDVNKLREEVHKIFQRRE